MNVFRLENRISLIDINTIDQLKSKTVSLKIELETTNKIKNSQSSADTRTADAAKKIDDTYRIVSHFSDLICFH